MRLHALASAVRRHARYGLAVVGPVGTAGAQFLLSFQLLHALQPQAFGRFSFLLIASQLSTGLSSALFCAPLPIITAMPDRIRSAALVRSILACNLWLSGGSVLFFLAAGWLLEAPPIENALFAAYGALMLLRWLARAEAYVAGAPARTIASDLVYAGALLAGLALMWASASTALAPAYLALALAAAASLLPFGRDYLRRQFASTSPRDIPPYAEVWRTHSSWSLTGVLTTEATANAHAYIVTLFSGPSAFAQVAASALLIRPITVAMNALGEFERPQMARLMAKGELDSSFRQIRIFRWTLVALWFGNVGAALALLAASPRLVFPAHYGLRDLTIGSFLWLVIACVRLSRTPESILLQSVGQFRPLALASVVSSGVSILAVLGLLAAGGPLWSVAGILLGEGFFAISIWIQTARWKGKGR